MKDLLRKETSDDALRTVLDKIDEEEVYRLLMDRLDIQETSVDQESLDELFDYLKLLDIVDTIPVINLERKSVQEQVMFTQPGLRYSLAKELIQTLLHQEALLSLPLAYLDRMFELLLNDVKGRLLEDIVYLHQKRVKHENIAKISFLIGEIDMVRYDKASNACTLYEIKHALSERISGRTCFLCSLLLE